MTKTKLKRFLLLESHVGTTDLQVPTSQEEMLRRRNSTLFNHLPHELNFLLLPAVSPLETLQFQLSFRKTIIRGPHGRSSSPRQWPLPPDPFPQPNHHPRSRLRPRPQCLQLNVPHRMTRLQTRSVSIEPVGARKLGMVFALQANPPHEQWGGADEDFEDVVVSVPMAFSADAPNSNSSERRRPH